MVAARPHKLAALVLLVMMVTNCAARPPTDASISQLSDIEGQWDIVSFDNYRPQRLDLDGERHAFVDISARGGFSFAIECNYSGLSGRLDRDGRLIASPEPSVITTMGCGPTRNARDDAFFAFFRRSPLVTISGNELTLRSGRTALVLQRLDVRRADALPTELATLAGRWSAPIIYHDIQSGHNRNLLVELNGAAASVQIIQDRMVLSFDCERVEARANLTAPGMLRMTDIRRRTSPPCRMNELDRSLAVSLISGQAELERIDGDNYHLVSASVRAVLQRGQ